MESRDLISFSRPIFANLGLEDYRSRDQWRLVVKLTGRAAKFHHWLNIWDCRPGCFYNIVAFPVTAAVLILSNS